MALPKLFTDGSSNPKTAKSDKAGRKFLTKILHLAPASLSGFNVCSSSSVGCRDGCLNTAGRGQMTTVQKARIRKTLQWFNDRDTFKAQIIKELTAFVKRCEKLGVSAAIRMNGTSDILWEKQFSELFTLFPQITYYDYTKHVKRCLDGYGLPQNYHLTFSRSESNDADCYKVLQSGRHNVAAVVRTKHILETTPSIWGFDTYSADNDDLRFLDPPGSHFGLLYAKGKARKDSSGFVFTQGAMKAPSLPVLA